MLESFRRFIQSKLGAGIALAVLILIALAFASGDVASSGNFGGVSGGDRVASVGDDRIDTAELSQAATSALERVKQENPRMSMKAFLASGALDEVLDDLIDRTALGEFGRGTGIVASQALIDSEITQIPAFRGPDGKFSQDAYRQALRQQGLSEKMVREDIAQGLIARQLLQPAALGAMVPREFALRYAALLRDRRAGAVALLPSMLFAPAKPPTEAELAAWYAKNSDRFIRPERRVIRYASFGEEALKGVPAPTADEIAARYNQNKAQYLALETRNVTQLIVPTEAAAQAIVAEVRGGASLESAATSKGLATAKLEKQARDALARQTSTGVADAVFASARGAIATPVRSPLGWHVVRIDAVETRPGRSLEQASAEISTQIATEKRRAAFTDLLAGIEEGFDSGGNLPEAAKDLGATVAQTGPVTADGEIYGKPGQRVPPILAKVVETAFSMEGEGQPQLAEVEPGKSFVIFDVAGVEPSAPAPLAEVKQAVVAAWMTDRGYAEAGKSAKAVQAAMAKGGTLQQAMATLKRPLPPVQSVTMSREELSKLQQSGQQVPQPIALMFSMAQGTTKLLKAPDNRGWFVVRLDRIEPGKVTADDPLLAAAQRQLGQVVGNEYAEAMRRAIRSEVGVTRNPAAIKAVRGQLDGSGS